MIQTAEEFVELRSSDDPKLYNRAAHETASEDVWLDVITRFPDMKKWVVHNKTVPNSILRILSKDTDSGVRSWVAGKRKLDHSIMLKLTSDPDESVRLAVAMNKKAPIEVLERLIDDEWERVAEVARSRIKALR